VSLPRTPFGSVCHLVNAKAFKTSDWSGAGVPIIRIQNLNGAEKPFNYWAGALDKQVIVKTGDLLLAWSGTPGTSFGAHIWSGPNGILNQHIFRCDLDQKAITKEWARIAVNHRLHRLIEQAHGGVGLQHVTRGMVEELEIPLPPLAEQRRIAEVLDRAEVLRAKRRAALAQLDSLTQSLFLDLFGDPATNPKRWRTDKLSAFCDLMNGFAFRSSDYVEESQTLNCRMSNIRPNGEFDVDYHPKYLPDAFAEKYKSYVLKDGDVIIAMTDMATEAKILGVPTVVTTKGKTLLLNQRVGKLVIEDSDSITFSYLRQLLAQPYVKKYYQRFAGGGVQINLGKGDLLSVGVTVPPISLQREFARRVTALEALKTAQRASLAELDTLFATLQHRAFRGEL
jgi:type I restriction enzyme S subunit